MDFEYSPRTQELRENLLEFMDSHIYPAEPVWHDQVEESGDPYFHPPVMEELKQEARSRGLWNLFLPDERFGAGLTNLEYAPLAEITGRSHIAPGGAQLRGARHREHGDPDRVRHARAAAGTGSSRCSRARSGRASR